VLCLVLASYTCLAKSIEDRKWIRMDSPNFSVYSMLSKGRTKQLVRHLEATFALFPALSRRAGSLVPTEIFVLDQDMSLADVGLAPDTFIGLFVPGLRKNTIIVGGSEDDIETYVATHEYVHFLLHNLVRFPFPAWFQEGYATYVEVSYLHSDGFVYGVFPRRFARTLGDDEWLPLADVIDSRNVMLLRNEETIKKFYQQSWLLVHYLQNRPDGESYVLQSLGRYGNLLLNGATETEAFEQGFGIPIDELEGLLRAYANHAVSTGREISVRSALRGMKTKTRRISREESSVLLARLKLLLESNRSSFIVHSERQSLDPDTEERVRELLEIGLDSEATRARATMGIGMLLEMQGDPAEAERRLVAAADMIPEDYDLQLDAAFFYLDRYLTGDDSAIEPMKRYAARAGLIDDTGAAFNFLRGMLLRSEGKFEESAGALQAAALKAPADHTSRVYLIDVNTKLGRFDRSRQFAKELLAFPHLPGEIATYLFDVLDESGGDE
jgi:hypothetical protein